MTEAAVYNEKTPPAADKQKQRLAELTDGLAEWVRSEMPTVSMVTVSGEMMPSGEDEGSKALEGEAHVRYVGRPRAAASMLGAALAQIVKDVWDDINRRSFHGRDDAMQLLFMKEFVRAVAAGFLPNLDDAQAHMVLRALESLNSTARQEAAAGHG